MFSGLISGSTVQLSLHITCVKFLSSTSMLGATLIIRSVIVALLCWQAEALHKQHDKGPCGFVYAVRGI